ncbi:MAG: amidohydrolase family protein [Gammaproteobacteria bacterium]
MHPLTPEVGDLDFAGRILDTDGHLYLKPDALRDLTREMKYGGGFVLKFLDRFFGSEEDRRARAGNRDKVWATKGISALGAYDAAERLEAMDRMGIQAQMIFANTFSSEMRVNSDAARRVCRAYNDYVLDWARGGDADRLRVAAQINMGDIDWALAETARCIKAGFKAITLPAAVPPGGVSPAHARWAPLWAMCQEANVVATLHLGAGGLTACEDPDDPMFPDRGWADADTLSNPPAERAGGEEAVSPYFLLVAHIPAEVFLITMVMGRVFERFPRLRFGMFEFGTSWIGPTVARMDMWAAFLEKTSGRRYEMKPSDFVRRNVRVAPFWHEKFAETVSKYGLQDVFCFMSDYPHHEGGRDPVGAMRRWTGEIGAGYDRAFFIDNARLMFP